MKDADRKLFVIVDNLRVHKAKVVTAWVAENTDRVKVFYLPRYAPERNPDEYLNNEVMQALGRRSTPMDKVAMKARLRSHMQGLQRRPTKVRSFFQAHTFAMWRDQKHGICLGAWLVIDKSD